MPPNTIDYIHASYLYYYMHIALCYMIYAFLKVIYVNVKNAYKSKVHNTRRLAIIRKLYVQFKWYPSIRFTTTPSVRCCRAGKMGKKKQARYRQRKNSSIASGCGDSNYCTTDSTTQLKTTQQQHEDLLNKNPQLPTFQSIQINQKNLQGGDNLLQHRCKRKTPPFDAPEVKSNKKKG